MTTVTSKRYEAERRRLFLRRTTTACLLGLVLVPLSGPIDYFAYHSHFTTLLLARGVSVAVTAVILGLLRHRIGRQHAYLVGIALCVEVALAVAIVPAYVTGIDTPHYVSLSVLILSCAALLPWRAPELAFLSTLLAAAFAAAAMLHGPLPTPTMLPIQLSAIIATGIIGIVIASSSDKLRARVLVALRTAQVASNEKTRLIEHLRQKTGELESVNQELSMLNQEMEDILYVSSHDLRAPLINVQGFTNEVGMSLAELRPYTGAAADAVRIHTEIQESLGFIQSAIGRMDALITGLLNVSRVTTRTNPTEEVSLQRAVETIVESFRFQLEQQAITVRVGDLPTVRGDPVRLNQVFGNLVDNAIKYMGQSARREIEIGVRDGNGTGPTLFVSDTGPGIPADSHETVFRLFRRLVNKGIPGEGLGLAMVRKIVEKHGGRIWVESAPGEGSTFCFTLGSRASS